MTKKRKWLLAGGALLALVAAADAGIYAWSHWRSGPRIGLSISDVWYDATQINPAPYAAAIARAGAKVRTLSPGDDLDRALDGLDGIVLAGSHEDVDPALYGGDPSRVWGVNRARDDFEIELLRRAEARGLPVLAVCRGAQLLAVAHGGKLRALEGDSAKRHGVGLKSLSAHTVRIDPSSRLHGAMGEGPHPASSTHFHAIADPGPRLRATAWAEDGVIEAVELPGPRFVVGVQWHPELEARRAPFRLLVEAVRWR